MKWAKLTFLLLVILFGACSASEAQTQAVTRKEAIEKTRHWAQNNDFVKPILVWHKDKDLLNPQSKFSANSVQVSQDLREVRFHHNGNPYNGDRITIVVRMGENLSSHSIEILITPGGAQ